MSAPETFTILTGLTSQLAQTSSLEEGLLAVTEAALTLTGANHASVRLWDELQAELRTAARSGVGESAPAPVFRKGEGILGWVAANGSIARIADCKNDPRFRNIADRGFFMRSILSVPLASGPNVVGVLSLSSPVPEAFSSDHEHVGQLLANCAAQRVRIAELEHLAATDSLTLAFNRRYLGPRMLEEMERSRRTNAPLSLLLMDLDHFKTINDLHGHAMGDRVLRAFADGVREKVRSFDVFIRRSGEEFILVMPATSGEEALQVAERIRASTPRRGIRTRWGNVARPTVSIGVATWDGAENPETLEHRADVALYQAKRHGRNQVVSSSPVGAPLFSDTFRANPASPCVPPTQALPAGGVDAKRRGTQH